MGASVSQTGLSSPTEPSSTVSALTGFDPSRIGDLPERLFAHSLELIGDDEEEEPSALFNEIQDAAVLLAEIRNSACPSCNGLNISCPEGCGRDPITGELDGSTLRAWHRGGPKSGSVEDEGAGRQASPETPIPSTDPELNRRHD